jgi:(2Fe-2S) ferredoxin
LHRFELDRHDDLIGLDLGVAGTPVEHPVFLVCTHGKHDRCCARYGRPIYESLREQVEDGWAWQSTHVGGDRFAGNVVILPQGLYYGRVEPGDVTELLEAHMSGRIEMEHYRGRAAHTFPLQAAEHAIRESERLVGIDDLELVGADTLGDGWRVRFRTTTAAVIEADVTSELSDEPVHLTCGAAEPQRARHYTATALRRL